MKRHSLKNNWNIICKSSSVDKFTNTLSIFEIIEKFEIEKAGPVNDGKELSIPIDYQIISHWSIDNEEKLRKVGVKVTEIDPKGNSLSEFSTNFEIEPDKDFHRTLIRVQGLKANTSGIYIFRIESIYGDKTEVVAEVPLRISIKNKLAE